MAAAGNLETVTVVLGIALAAGFITLGMAIVRAERSIDESFGDWPCVPGELAADRNRGGEGGLAAGHRRVRHIAHDKSVPSR